MCESISDTEFAERVLQNGKRPTLIVFGAAWSGTYQMLQNVINGIAEEFSDSVDFFQTDIEESPIFANMMNIREIPSIFIFFDGEVIDHFTGLHSSRKIQTRLKRAIDSC